MNRDFQHELFDLLLAADRQSANGLIDEWARDRSYERAVIELLEPALRLLGERWSKEEDVSLAQGYIAGKIAEDLMAKVTAPQTSDPAVSASKGPVVIGNIQDDCHGLGRKLVVIFLQAAGWKVYDLGNDVAPGEFVDKAVEVDAPIIGASAMMYMTAMNIKELREEIDRRGFKGKMRLAVGGAVFVQRPELVEDVGGDGTAQNALDTPNLMSRLLDSVIQDGGAA